MNGSASAWTRPAPRPNVAGVMRCFARVALTLLLGFFPGAGRAAEIAEGIARTQAVPLPPAMQGTLVAAWARSGEVAMSHRAGDDPRWAAPDWDDRDWAPGNMVPMRRGIHWVRFHFVTKMGMRPHFLAEEPLNDVSGLTAETAVDSVFTSAPYSFELYWDGRLIGRSGVVGATRETEMTDRLDHVFTIPAELLRSGEHVVAMRVSGFHYNFPAKEVGIGFLISNLAGHYAFEMRRPVFPLVSVGGALLVALLSAVMYFLVDRWRPLLLCGLLGLVLAVFYLLIAWRWIHPDPYDWFYPRLVTIAGLMAGIAWLFPWLLLEQFAVPRARWWLVALLPLLVAAWWSSPIYEYKTLWLGRAMLVLSMAIAAWAMRQRRPGAAFVFFCALLGLLLVDADRREFVNPWFFVIFGVLVLFVFTMLGLQLRADRRRAEQATLTAARLEIELLKKNIQPHFLMNTLTTIMEVIEQEPKSAVTLIEALAAEFRILARVAGEKLIPLAQELELCRAHLRIMGLRRGVECSLETRGVDDNSPVPPALLHTLVEGGLTHQGPRAGRLKFAFDAYYQPGLARYTLVVHGENPAVKTPLKDGTGLRYVKARLEESFAGRWTLVAGPVAEGWQTMIEIKVRPGEEAIT